MNKLQWSTEYLTNEYPTQPYSAPSKLDQTGLMYPVSPFYASTVTTSPSSSPLSSSSGTMYGPEPFVASSPPFVGSPDSLMSGFASAPIYHPPPLVQSTSSSTMSSTSSAYLNETIAKASALPESFYPEFLQYSKESFEQQADATNSNSCSRKQGPSKKRAREEDNKKEETSDKRSRKQKSDQDSTDTNVSELRRQIHIQSEQKRRAQIKDGFEDLRSELPACLNKKMSKVTLLHRTVQHIQHLKSTQMTILAELERLVQENEQLRSFQQSVLQKQALENMYSM
ncbi:hypothetical protein G6F70_005058 [Rhizopus microsporus]|uniref:BHLH domain-containing protein n=1 Tax=Rhizopus azygosporus TaxID=86630 RepID=A0A367J7V7_RHIAZ|nr:hypothetical protein G6F71_004544 [Rhizopus microsporus]RCH86013.1 hypothetical protein CU097_006603 [Rhizopus azygosporus]KAG1199293.1 hypothetical protein G6F70_005058 [Rhizopus microsporus]KAG1211104.1 hypothetical protein G6F69_004889 [Rhizopus microsporus]KAG1228688.1 hypothetical protein G6F67_007657 [Rhizopus microsporus]